MAYRDPYMSEPDFRRWIGETTDRSVLNNRAALEDASDWWDLKLRRPAGFNRTDEPEGRVFYAHRGPRGCGSPYLDVDDLASLEGLTVSIDGQEVNGEDYVPWPPNALKERTPKPFELLVCRRRDGWPLGRPITVTAYFGWPEVPALIRELTGEWAAVWLGKSIRTTARVNELDSVESTSLWHQSQVKRAALLFQRARRASPEPVSPWR